MRYPWVLLDADDTLLDFDRSETSALHDTLERCGISPDDDALSRYKEINKRWWRAFERREIVKSALVVGRWAEFLESCGSRHDAVDANAFYMHRLGSYSFTLPGAAELCAALKDRGCRLALVTNGTADVQRRRWGASPASRYFDEKDVFISEVLGYQKPDREFFDLVLQSLGDPPRERCVILGDSETSDMRGGKNAGLATCWYNPEGIQGSGPWDHEIRSLDQFLTIV